jgi:ketopantoate reductase
MHIAILGAGAMGSLFGGLLAEAGHCVTLLVALAVVGRHIPKRAVQRSA